MSKYFIAFVPVVLLVLLANLLPKPESATLSMSVNEKTSVAEILEELGDEALPHKPNLTLPNVSAEEGRYLVLTGFAQTQNGRSTSKQSAHFVCTSCHNIQRDEPDLSIVDPEAKLDFVEERGLPFLQGTALYGAINRTSFYNEDYYKKYGELVTPARDNIREAIQLCAVECAQGRPLEAWEIESILAYLWTIDLKLGDLKLADSDYEGIAQAIETSVNRHAMIDLIKSKYLDYSPATFIKPPEDRKEGYAKEGDPVNGERIYKLSCLHCHQDMRYSFFDLNDSKLSLQFLEKHIPRYTRYSLYQVGRYGTSPMPGKRSYMPHYTLEKMTNQQMEDLRAYIESGE
ncbi:MAG: cytochrome c [Bacteroidota bacterium]